MIKEIVEQRIKFERLTLREFIFKKIFQEPLLFFSIFVLLPILLFMGVSLWFI